MSFAKLAEKVRWVGSKKHDEQKRTRRMAPQYLIQALQGPFISYFKPKRPANAASCDDTAAKSLAL